MIARSIFTFLVLISIVSFAYYWSVRHQNSKLIRILPTPLWCYIPPTILATLGILPSESVVYDLVSAYVLPACLIFLLMTTDLKSFKRIGRLALVAMLIGSGTIIIGGTCAFALFRTPIGPESWKAIGTLTASWIGGTANMIAVKQALGLSDNIFGALFISDITTVYLWMTLLMLLSGHQERIDRFLRADHSHLNQYFAEEPSEPQTRQPKTSLLPRFGSSFFLLVVGFCVGGIAYFLGQRMPEIRMTVSHSTWTIILVTTFGLLLSAAPYAKRQSTRATNFGYFFLYLILATTGAKANLAAILKAPLFLAMAFTLVVVHGALFLLVGRLLRVPIAILATASQANVGGIASTPIVASTFDRKLVPIAILLALFGNAAANYLAILTAYFLRSLGC